MRALRVVVFYGKSLIRKWQRTNTAMWTHPHVASYAERMPIDFGRITIDRYAHVPLYRQLADQLRQMIEEGVLQRGEQIPSQQSIGDAAGISLDAVRHGIEILVGEGLIIRRHGSPTRVADPPPVRILSAARYAHELEILLAGGEHPPTSAFTEEHGIDWADYTIDVDGAREKATARDAELLAVKPGSPILRRTFVKRIAGEPVQLQWSAIPWDIAGGTPVADPSRQPWPGGTIAELYSLGLEVTRILEDIQSRPARDDERRRLRMQTPGPVQSVVRVFWAGDRPVETSRVTVDAARYVFRFETDLTRPGGEA